MKYPPGFAALQDMMNQLCCDKSEPKKRIAALNIDSIFFELEADLNLLVKNEALKPSYLETQIYGCQDLLRQSGQALTALKAVKHLNDHQFYCFVRLKKLYSNLKSFVLRYQVLLEEIATSAASPQ